MLPSKFFVDTDSFYKPVDNFAARPGADPCSILAKKEQVRFAYIDSINQWLEGSKATEKRIKIIDVVSKIIRAVTALITAFLPVGMYYLPIWAPLGIGLPVVIILSLINGKLQKQIEANKRDNEFVPFLKELLQAHSFKALHPLGEWDLPAVDERLKSDLMMRNELHKRHHKSGKEVENLVQHNDLEITPSIEQSVACKFANIENHAAKWTQVVRTNAEAAKAFRQGKNPVFFQKQSAAQAVAYEQRAAAGGSALSIQKYVAAVTPPPSARDQIKAVVMTYQKFCQMIPEVEILRGEGMRLYGDYPFLPEHIRTFPKWIAYSELADKALGEMTPLIELLQKVEPSAQEYFDKLLYIQDKNLNLTLFDLIDQTRQIKNDLKSWIANHPSQRLDRLKKKFETYFEKGVLSRESLREFAIWKKQHPTVLNTKIIALPQMAQLPESVQEWVSGYSNFRFETVTSVFQSARRIYDAYANGLKKLEAVEAQSRNIGKSAQDYADFEKALTQFQKQTVRPIDELIIRQGTTSKIQVWLKALFSTAPTVPFVKEKLSKHEARRSYQVEHIKLNVLLKQADKSVLWTNRARLWGLKIPLYLLVAIEGIFFLVFPSPWVFWGCCALALGGEALSFYVDYRLRQMDRKKQSLKLQHLLMNHPDIGAVPGTRPGLHALKRVQQQYGLEGVRPTWARALAEGDGILKQSLQSIAREGKKKATSYLEDRLIILYSDLALSQKKSRNWQLIKKRILTIKKTIQQKTSFSQPPVKQPLSEYEKCIRERNQIDVQMDQVVEQIDRLQRMCDEYQGISQQFERLSEQITLLNADAPILTQELQWLSIATRAENPKDLHADPDLILGKMVDILHQVQTNQNNQFMESQQQELNTYLLELKSVPREKLFACGTKLNERMDRLRNAHTRFEWYAKDPDYRSKEFVDQKIAYLQAQIKQHEEKKDELKIQFDQLSERIEQAKPDDLNMEYYSSLAVAKALITYWPKKANTDTYKTLWEQQKKDFEEAFVELQAHHKDFVYHELPAEIRVLFKPFYEEHAGRTLLVSCQKAYRDICLANRSNAARQNALNDWWKKKGLAATQAFQKLDSYFQNRVKNLLPAAMRDMLV